jgi:hypothetical protein
VAGLIGAASRPAPRFAIHELAYLLATRTNFGANRSREWLGIPSVTDDEKAVELGLSSLVARGLVGEQEGSILPRNEAGLVGFVLGTATKWITVTVRVGEEVDLAHFVQGTGMAVMARHAPADTIDFLAIKQNYDADVAAIASVERVLDAGPDIALLVRVDTAERERGVFVRNDPTVGWRIGFDPVFPGDAAWPAPDLELAATTRADAFAAATRTIRHPEGEE